MGFGGLSSAPRNPFLARSRAPGVLSRENRIGIAFIVFALLSAYAALQFDAPSWAVSAIILGVGVVSPLLLNDYLDRREDAGAD